MSGFHADMTWRFADGLDAAAWRDALAASGALSGSASGELKREGENWVRRVTLSVGGRQFDVIVKHRIAGGPGEILKMRLGGSRFARHWRGAAWLLANGLLTGRPLAHGRRVHSLRIEEVLVVEFVPGRTVLEHLAAGDLSLAQERAAAHELASMVARLGLLRRYNRDGKPSNLVRTADGRIAILDTVAIRSVLRGPRDADMLASLVIEPLGTGCRPRRALMMRVVRGCIECQAADPAFGNEPLTSRERHSMVWGLWKQVARRVRRHGDPRPRTNPLGGTP